MSDRKGQPNRSAMERRTAKLITANSCIREVIIIIIIIIISKCSKLAQREYKARHDWVGKVIHGEMCKKFKFDHTNKWYMAQPSTCPRK